MIKTAQNSPLDASLLMKYAPSIYATQPKEGLSQKYAFIPTSKIVDLLQGEGWHAVHAVHASQSRAKTEGGREYVKHMLRFERENMNKSTLKEVGDVFPQIVLTNSHDGSSAFVFSAGLYRLACSNGLVVADTSANTQRVRHVGFKDSDVIEASYRIVEDLPKIMNQVATYQSIEMKEDERVLLAAQAANYRWGEGSDYAKQYTPQLLQPRRYGDGKTDLWTTFNVIQENIIKGGLRGHSATSRRVKTKAVSGVGEDVKLNKALWEMTEHFRKLKQGVTA